MKKCGRTAGSAVVKESKNMKTKIIGSLFSLAGLLAVHAQTGGYTVTERGPDWKVLQKTTVENGTNRVHRYVELATGLNYTNASGQLAESKEQITIQPGGGAAAVQGRHKVYFPHTHCHALRRCHAG